LLLEACGGWKTTALLLLRLVPRPAADRIYSFIAANRYK
jgi:predicted DCC family thiol-disulfide oxidoreductase YuxK